MKVILFSLLLFAFANINFAQDKIFILMRHAEKDVSPTADKANPNLTEAGKKRAEKLLEVVKKYRPDEIFSTNFIRTRDTVTPSAINLYDKYRLQIQIYDHTELDELAKNLLASKSKTFVIVGHNTTTPMLANILAKEDKFNALDESEYDKIFIIKIKKKQITSEKIVY
ncbi:MAG: histidine phosphatase family protein [Pyrinomonadaceae bacterium]|nr:histidine phosphatase family protein [Pyrinomonadaceae bacterium]